MRVKDGCCQLVVTLSRDDLVRLTLAGSVHKRKQSGVHAKDYLVQLTDHSSMELGA